MTTEKRLIHQDIIKLIPHRYPMLLVDYVDILKLNEEAIGTKNVTANENFFQGHFPDNPIMPGVFIVEALAQTSAVLVMHTLMQQDPNFDPQNSVVYFMSINNTRFIKPVTPGDTLKLKVTNMQNRSMVWKFKGQAYVGDDLHTESEYKAMIAKKGS